MSDYVKFEKKRGKFDTVAKIQELLDESGLYWSCTYIPNTDSYSLFICDRDYITQDASINNDVSKEEANYD